MGIRCIVSIPLLDFVSNWDRNATPVVFLLVYIQVIGVYIPVSVLGQIYPEI